MNARRSIEIAGFRHRNPVPNASRIGGLLMSGLIVGTDPATGACPAGLAAQTRQVFAHIASIVAAAGMGCDDIIKLDFRLADPDDRAALNAEWLAMFPEPASRPARRVEQKTSGGEALITAELVAFTTTTTTG